jgi:low affinity Fe/Cu permease
VFDGLATFSARLMGSGTAFGIALAIVAIWALTGPLFGYSDTWQLIINTGTTIVTFLMVFLIQNTQNRDSTSIQLKLDELIRATRGAHNAVFDLEEWSQQDLEKIRALYETLAKEARQSKNRLGDTGTPEVAPSVLEKHHGTGDRYKTTGALVGVVS